MIPDNNHYDSLQVYYDYLEDDGYETEELRESLLSSHNNWAFEFRHFHGFVGSSYIRSDFVGSSWCGFSVDNVGNNIIPVGTTNFEFTNDVGARMAYEE